MKKKEKYILTNIRNIITDLKKNKSTYLKHLLILLFKTRHFPDLLIQICKENYEETKIIIEFAPLLHTLYSVYFMQNAVILHT